MTTDKSKAINLAGLLEAKANYVDGERADFGTFIDCADSLTPQQTRRLEEARDVVVVALVSLYNALSEVQIEVMKDAEIDEYLCAYGPDPRTTDGHAVLCATDDDN